MAADTLLVKQAPLPSDSIFVISNNRILASLYSNRQVSLPVYSQLSGLSANSLLFIGERLGRRYFLVIDSNLVELSQLPQEHYAWLPLRQLLFQLEEQEFVLAGKAIQLYHWKRDHQFCSRCGHHCTKHQHEFAMVCCECDYHQYPRINPCVIVLVTKGDKALLARNSQFKGGFYSCLAGFIEAGESAEQALHREVLEEVGIEIDNFSYYGSQSWPFPHSLMLGFYAQWKAGELVPDGDEIIEAGWFSVNNLPEIPAQGSIAYQLINGWQQQVQQQ